MNTGLQIQVSFISLKCVSAKSRIRFQKFQREDPCPNGKRYGQPKGASLLV